MTKDIFVQWFIDIDMFDLLITQLYIRMKRIIHDDVDVPCVM